MTTKPYLYRTLQSHLATTLPVVKLKPSQQTVQLAATSQPPKYPLIAKPAGVLW